MISDLSHLVIDPLINDRIAIATPKAIQRYRAAGDFAIWATVSSEVDARIAEQTKAGVFSPIWLKPEDWKSGKIVWLLDDRSDTRARDKWC